MVKVSCVVLFCLCVFSLCVILSSVCGSYLLLCRICLIVWYSFSLLFSFRGYVVSLFARYRMAAVCCSGGWFESFGMIVSVAVGFQYILKDIFGCLCMVMSRKFILLLISCSIVKCRV